MVEIAKRTNQGVMPKRPHVLMLFLDGVGIGRKDPTTNPFFFEKLYTLSNLLHDDIPHKKDSQRFYSDVSLVPLNATLGVRGLPQSGTGQTALFTGKNAARIINKHFGPYPYSSLRPIIERYNIFHRLSTIGRSVYFANAYPQKYFEHLKLNQSRQTVTSMSWKMAGFELNDSRSLDNGQGISADITNEGWAKLGYPKITVITPQQAGQNFVDLTNEYDFVLFEYFLTDRAGHSQSMNEAVIVLKKFDDFLSGILNSFDDRSMLLLITSDHGNIEDLSTKSHTRNPVPLIALGAYHQRFVKDLTSLIHVTPRILHLYQ
ncbi:MAG TPA: hypothetical protein VFF29_03945 [Bacteroidota bacterium]|nr:hypothetical protein [Bacteroidota bacterium]